MFKIFETACHIQILGRNAELKQLVDEFAFRPEGYWYAPSYERWVLSDGKEGWDGFLRPFRRMAADGVQALRGRKNDFLSWAKDNGYEVDVEKLLPLPFKHLTIDDIDPGLIAGDFKLDDSQRRCILQWLRNVVAINQVTVSGGKTAMFAGAVAFLKLHYPKACILYLTPSERLVRQSTKDLRHMLPQYDIGQFGGGQHQKAAKDVVVCTVAMLSRNFLVLSHERWFKRFMAICYDEVHHAGAATSQKVLLAIPAFFRFGASDTTKEKDERRWTDIRGLFGQVYNVIKAAPLIQIGRIAKPHIYVADVKAWNNRFEMITYEPPLGSPAYVLVDDGWRSGIYRGPVHERDSDGEIVYKEVKTAIKDEEGNWIIEQKPVIIPGLHTIEIDEVSHEIASKWCLLQRVYDRAIIQFEERNNLIVEWAKYYSGRKLPTVVVCTRTLHVYILEALLKKAVNPKLVDILVGKDTPKARDDCFDWFRQTKGAVLITPLVKEGVSIREIRAGVIADYIADWEVANQVVGRFIRPKTGGDNSAEITWIRDRQHPSLRRGCNGVFRALEQIEGYTFYDPAPTIESLRHGRQAELNLT